MAQQKKLKVNLLSFGFKHGVPENCNYVWDVRFLPNPYWEEELRDKTGLEHGVSDYVIGSPEGNSFIKLLKPMLLYLVQQNSAADKQEITLAVGCTGGRHRSVSVVEVLADIMMMLPAEVHIQHRDIEKDG